MPENKPKPSILSTNFTNKSNKKNNITPNFFLRVEA